MKMIPCLKQFANPLRDRRGIAFPVALLGLVALSVMITGVLLTASTEVTLSSAHKDATRDFYNAQGGLEAYVAQAGMGLAPVNNFRYLPPNAPPSDSALITVTRLGSAPAANPAWPADSLYVIESRSIVRPGQPATAQNSRTVAMMARIASSTMQINNGIQAAVVTGSDLDIVGNTTVSDGRDSQLCSPDSASRYALQAGADDTVTWRGNSRLVGDTGRINSPSTQFVKEMLNVTMQDLINNANIRFGPGQFSGNTTVTSIGSVSSPSNRQATPLNWGCPVGMTSCVDNTNPSLDRDSTFFPIVAIDASNPTTGAWDRVVVNLSHGQGIVVVYNGNLRIQGNLIFKGVIIVEGSFDVYGNGQTGAKIEGSVIGLGMGPGGQENSVDNDIGGTPTIRYNRCAINAVVATINQTQNTFIRTTPPTTAWYEVVR